MLRLLGYTKEAGTKFETVFVNTVDIRLTYFVKMKVIQKNIASYKGHVTRAVRGLEKAMEVGNNITETRCRLIKKIDSLEDFIEENETSEIRDELAPYYEYIQKARAVLEDKLKAYHEMREEAMGNDTDPEDNGATSQQVIHKTPKTLSKNRQNSPGSVI